VNCHNGPGVLFTDGKLPIEDFTPAIRPKGEGHQHHHALACTLMTSPSPLIHFDCLLLTHQREPDAIQLHHGWHFGKRLAMGLLHLRFDLIDALIDRAQTHLTLQDGTPLLAQVAQTLTETTAKKGLLIQIQPKALIFLQDGKRVFSITEK
jgi:hypothetical protein